MLFSIILLPFLGFISGSFFGRYLGVYTCFVATSFTFFSSVLSFLLFFDIVSTGNVYIFTLSKWIHTDSLQVNWNFCFDSLTSVMLIVVTFISTLVHLYSIEYMENDPHLPRFMSYLSLFTFFMLILVTANNFLQMFVGWEGVGVSSFLLISFWFTRIQANKSAIKAMLMNRVGDFALLIAIFLIVFLFNSLDYEIVFSLVPLALDYRLIISIFQIPVLDLVSIFLFLGAMGKSAQFGLHTWLPDAMEGPTPVSALIHAATMVTAGVFLVARCSYFFEFSELALNFIVIIGSATAFFSATTGLFQNDMKKVIAYSTCSQLGYMVFACGLSSYEVGLFHLSNHAFFKALLFLGSGSIIHAVSNEQDVRKLGGLKNVLPFSYAIMLIGSLALMGFPFLAGFYSKDVILEISFAKYTIESHFSFVLGTLAAFATAFYSIRLLFLVFLANPNGNKNILFSTHEGTWKITLPLFLLSLFSIFIGFLSKDLFIGFGTNFWGSSIFILPQNYMLSDIEFIDIKAKITPLIVTIFGALFSYFLYRYKTLDYFFIKRTSKFKSVYNFFNKKWFFDRIYNQLISKNALSFGYSFTYKSIDRGLLEKIGPSGIVFCLAFLTDFIKPIQTGFVFHYMAYILGFTFVFIIFSTKLTFLLLFFLFFSHNFIYSYHK